MNQREAINTNLRTRGMTATPSCASNAQMDFLFSSEHLVVLHRRVNPVRCQAHFMNLRKNGTQRFEIATTLNAGISDSL